MKSLFERENLKRGDKILANGEHERIFLTYIEGAKEPYVCVSDYCNTSFLMGKYFDCNFYSESKVSAKPKQWYDNIPKNGVICWVWDDNKRRTTDIIVGYDKPVRARFQSAFGLFWQNAEPIKPEDLYQGVVK